MIVYVFMTYGYNITAHSTFELAVKQAMKEHGNDTDFDTDAYDSNQNTDAWGASSGWIYKVEIDRSDLK